MAASHMAYQFVLRQGDDSASPMVPSVEPYIVYNSQADSSWVVPAGRPPADARGHWVLQQAESTGRQRLDYETWIFTGEYPGRFYISNNPLLEWTLLDQIEGKKVALLKQLPARELSTFIADMRVKADATAFTQRYEIAGPEATQAYTSTGGTSFLDTYPALAEMYWARNTGEYLTAATIYQIAREATAADRAEYQPYDHITAVASNMARRIRAIPLDDPEGKLALFGYLMTTTDPGGWPAPGGGS